MIELNFKSLYNFIFIFVFFFVNSAFSQDVDIVPYLKQIETGNVVEACDALVELKKNNPQNPSVLFLDGVLTENGQEAVVKYQFLVDNYPKSKYADAALYRIYSYYYALGLYETANERLKKLNSDYPESPYTKIAKQNLTLSEGVKKAEDNTETPVSAEQVKTTRNDSQYKFTIQAGAFTNLDNANSLKNNFEKAGIFSEVRDKIVGGTTFHVVYAGKFLSAEEAENFLAIVNSRFNLSGIVAPITWN